MVSSLIQEFQDYGISEGQAKLYLFLVGKPPVGARTILNALKLSRVDAYRKLRELEKIGLVQIHLGSPRTFSAVSPNIALSSLIQRLNLQVLKLKRSAKGLGQQLEDYGRTNNISESTLQDQFDHLQYRLVVGQEQYYKEMHSSFRNAKTEIFRIVSASGLKRSFSLGFHSDYLKAKLDGAKIRIISEIDSSNFTEAKRLSKVADIKHIDGIHLRFTVIDRTTTVFRRLGDDDKFARTSADSYLISDDTKFADACRFFFEHLWNISKTPTF
ncbi:MAG: TrmB family transcriptional regulator [Nitrososphaerales archaeon]